MIIIEFTEHQLMIFTELITDLQNELKRELAQIRFLIKKESRLRI